MSQLDLVWQARHWVRRDKPGPHRLMSAMADEIIRLRAAIQSIAEQDGTLSVVDGIICLDDEPLFAIGSVERTDG